MKQHLILCRAKAKDTGASSMTIKRPRNDDNHHFHLPEQRGKVFLKRKPYRQHLRISHGHAGRSTFC